MAPDLIAVHTTVGTEADALRIARALVERRLVACAQIGAIRSVYVWDGALQDDAEWRLLLKTTRDRYAEVEAAIVALHPYTLPAIWAVGIGPVHAGYAQWVREGSAPTD